MKAEFRADVEKQRQAYRATGLNIKLGYTWVIDHERGKGDMQGIKLTGFDLAERTLIGLPAHASKKQKELFKLT